VEVGQLVNSSEVIEVDVLQFGVELRLLLGVLGQVVNHESQRRSGSFMTRSHVVHDFGGDFWAWHAGGDELGEKMGFVRVASVYPFDDHLVDFALTPDGNLETGN